MTLEDLIEKWESKSSTFLSSAEHYHYEDMHELDDSRENHMMGCHRQWKAAIRDLKELDL